MAEVKSIRSKSEATKHVKLGLGPKWRWFTTAFFLFRALAYRSLGRSFMPGRKPSILSLKALLAGVFLVVCSATLCLSQAAAGQFTLANDSISANWSLHNGTLQWRNVTNRLTNESLAFNGPLFELLPKEGPVVRPSTLQIVGEPVLENIPSHSEASKAAVQISGRQLRVQFRDASGNDDIEWKAVLRDGTNYIREEVTIHAAKEPLALAQIHMVDITLPGAEVSGHAKGSPVTANTWFIGFEHPLSECRVRHDHASCWLSRELPVQAGQSVTYSSVIGVSHPGQLRRDFLRYLELERAHPYRTFLHYNSWYDLGMFGRYNEHDAVSVVHAFGEQLTAKRGVKLDSFMFDDGWDDPSTLWKFNPGFPDGLRPVTQEAAKYNAAPGIWLSPWGGYDGPKEKRLASARERGFETNEGGLALSGPKYYRYFRDTCLEMIDKYGVNQFKFDGTGNANEVIKGSEFDSDFDAAIHLIGELRVRKPDIYINLTTGTYPSPFWLLYADSIWRGGEDHSFAGVGTNRQRWITYRDSQIYRGIVEEGPLFPINSLMLHGIIFARYAERLSSDPSHDFPDEVHSYFGTGTQLQEMYITPSLLSDKDWDVLAETAKWSRSNAAVLKDSHWIGGDPAKLEVYGWAAWSPEKSIITLRNPGDKPQSLTADIASMLELPARDARNFTPKILWNPSSERLPKISAPEKHTFKLQPFEVLTLELKPSP